MNIIFLLLALIFNVILHELSHFLIAYFLGYYPKLVFDRKRMTVGVWISKLDNNIDVKLIAASGCVLPLLIYIVANIFLDNNIFFEYCLLFSVVFFANLLPFATDGKYLWEGGE